MQENSIILKKMFSKNSYIWRLNFCEKGMFTACVLITPLRGHKQRDLRHHRFRFATLHSFSLTSDFRTALYCVLRKPQSGFMTARKISLLKHGFSPIKTWLLIPRDTAVYAIICVQWVPKDPRLLHADSKD